MKRGWVWVAWALSGSAIGCGPRVGDGAGSGTTGADSTGSTGSSGGSTCVGASCGGSESSGGTSGDPTTAEGSGSELGSSTTGGPVACESFDLCCTPPKFCGGGGEPAFPLDLECGGPSPCEVVTVEDDYAGCSTVLDSEPVFESADAVRCVLQAFRDDTPGRYEIVSTPGIGSLRVVYQLLGDERVVAQETHICDVGGSCIEYVAFRKPTSFFDDCLASTDPGEQYRCLRQPVDESECIDADDACAPGSR